MPGPCGYAGVQSGHAEANLGVLGVSLGVLWATCWGPIILGRAQSGRAGPTLDVRATAQFGRAGLLGSLQKPLKTNGKSTHRNSQFIVIVVVIACCIIIVIVVVIVIIVVGRKR